MGVRVWGISGAAALLAACGATTGDELGLRSPDGKGWRPARALRAAQLALADDPRFSDPRAWASFVVVGRPR